MPYNLSPLITDSEAVIIGNLLDSQQLKQESEHGLNCLVVYSDPPCTSFFVPRRFASLIPQKPLYIDDQALWVAAGCAGVILAGGQQLVGPQSAFGTLRRRIEEVRGRDAGEHGPSATAIERAKELIEGAEPLVRNAPEGDLDFYYGELGIEWRRENRILRLTAFSDPEMSARLDYGTMSVDTPGEYRSELVANAHNLAERLNWLSCGQDKRQTA